MLCDELKWKWAYGPYLDTPEGQKESAIKAGYVKVVSKQSADAAIAEKDAEIESLKASHYAEMVDAGMRERRLKRALWLARALALSRFDVDEYLRKYTHCNSRFWNDGFNTFNEACEEMQKAINIAEAKCRAKAEQYK